VNPPFERTEAVDQLIGNVWEDTPGVALAAVGGYGRRELFPFSDIDLLFISERQDLKEPLAPFLRNLWDAGLRVSQSVHTVAECLQVDERNVELSVSLLDRRFLLGERTLFDRLQDPRRDKLAPHLARLTRERHRRFSETIYHLEPDIKDGPGGLRDLQVVRWLAKLEHVPAPDIAHDLLFRIRAALHERARRDQNQLTYMLQDHAAEDLGYSDADVLMQDFFRNARQIYRACIRGVEAEEARRSRLFASFRDRASRLSNADLSVIRGRIFLRSASTTPDTTLRLFEFVARHGIRLAPDTEDRVAQIAAPPITWSKFREILDLPHADLALRAMLDTGMLTRFFTGLQGIEALVIRDFYHRYTVDEHTMVAISTAVQLRNQPGQFGELARETPDYPLLLTALLFHDAGKAAKTGDHAVLSLEIAAQALAKIGMTGLDSERVLFLIGAHLEMSRVMLTRDLTDPAVAEALGKKVGTLEQLKLLTLLTYCDISAVNPDALTPWRSTLLWQLYMKTERYLTRSLEAERGSRYAIIHSPEELTRHEQMFREQRPVLLEKMGTVYRLTVVSGDRTFLFASVAGAIASFGMNILRAEAFTSDAGLAVESFAFADPLRSLELNPSEFERLEKVASDVVAGRKSVEDLLRSRPPVKAGGPKPEKRVIWDNEASPRATLFEIIAPDRPGLLYDLSRSISDAGCNIDVVLIDTEGRKAIDVFYITRDGLPLSNSSAEELRGILELSA
jgi:[protein-PII] uridylyltransferase